jgi:Flp pilus assembly protein TadG
VWRCSLQCAVQGLQEQAVAQAVARVADAAAHEQAASQQDKSNLITEARAVQLERQTSEELKKEAAVVTGVNHLISS